MSHKLQYVYTLLDEIGCISFQSLIVFFLLLHFVVGIIMYLKLLIKTHYSDKVGCKTEVALGFADIEMVPSGPMSVNPLSHNLAPAEKWVTRNCLVAFLFKLKNYIFCMARCPTHCTKHPRYVIQYDRYSSLNE